MRLIIDLADSPGLEYDLAVAAEWCQKRLAESSSVLVFLGAGCLAEPVLSRRITRLQVERGEQSDPVTYTEHRGMAICSKGRIHVPPCYYGDGL